MPVSPVISEETGREIASRLEAEHPLWMVIFGVYTQQFICFPRFQAPMLSAIYPEALPDRMRRAEEALRDARREGAAGSGGQGFRWP